jgi:hypothetical protein
MQYFNGIGTHQRTFDALFEELVPEHGPSATEFGNAIRACHALAYRLGNDGLGPGDHDAFEGHVTHLIDYCRSRGEKEISLQLGEMIEAALDGGYDDVEEIEDEQGKVLDLCIDMLCEMEKLR